MWILMLNHCLEVKNLSHNQSNVNTVTKYPKFSAMAETFLLAFQSLYMVLVTQMQF